MSSLNLIFPPAIRTANRRRVQAPATAAKSSGGGKEEEKNIWDFILGALAKQEQLYESDPILKKVEGKTSGTTSTTTSGRKNTVVVPPKKNDNPFAGLFNKKD